MPPKHTKNRRHTKPKTKITRKRRKAYGGERIPYMLSSQYAVENAREKISNRARIDLNVRKADNNINSAKPANESRKRYFRNNVDKIAALSGEIESLTDYKNKTTDDYDHADFTRRIKNNNNELERFKLQNEELTKKIISDEEEMQKLEDESNAAKLKKEEYNNNLAIWTAIVNSPSMPKPEDLASVPPQVQYEGVCYAHAFARSLLRTLRVLNLVTFRDNNMFYYALFTFSLTTNANFKTGGGANAQHSFGKFIDLIMSNSADFFKISGENITNMFNDSDSNQILEDFLKNIPQANFNTPFLKDFAQKYFIDKFKELYSKKDIYLMSQDYEINMNNVNPISTEIKNALERHLQPTIATYGHEMVVRGWGGTDNDINTIYIKNTWESHPLLVYADLNLVAKGIHHITRDPLNIFPDNNYDKKVSFTWLMISDKYKPEKGENEYMDSYVCNPTENCGVATENITTYMYDGTNWVIQVNKTAISPPRSPDTSLRNKFINYISPHPSPDTPTETPKYTPLRNKLNKYMKRLSEPQ